MTDQLATFAYNSNGGSRPWMKLGKPVDGCMTVEDALIAGGCNFLATKVPVEGKLLLPDDDGMPVEHHVVDPDHSMVVRTDTRQSLGVVGSRYKVVQMKDAFGFFDEALGENAAIIDSVGMINKGRTGFMIAKLPECVEIVPGDEIERYLMFTNSYDGSTPVTCLFMANRLACTNQLNASMRKSKNCVKIRHTKNAKIRIKEAHRILKANEAYWEHMKAALQYMASKQVTTTEVQDFVADLLPGTVNDDGVEEASTRTLNRREAIVKAFEESPGSDLAGTTAYGLFNAVTWHIDHEASLRKGTDRWEASLSGSGSKLRQNAFNLLTQLAAS